MKKFFILLIIFTSIGFSFEFNLSERIPTGFYGVVPSVDTDELGNLHLIYVAGNRIRYAMMRPDGTWTPSEEVPGSEGVDVQFNRPQVAAFVRNGSPVVNVVWGSPRPWRTLYYARKENGVWVTSGAFDQESGDDHVSTPRVDFSKDGIGHLIFQFCPSTECPTSLIDYWIYTDSTGWYSPPGAISDSSREWRDPAIVVDNLGRVHAVWAAARSAGQYRLRDEAGNWHPVEWINGREGTDTVAFGDIAVDKYNVPHRVFFSFPQKAIEYTYRIAEGQWSYPVVISAYENIWDDDVYDTWASIAIDYNDTIYVVWGEWGGPLGVADDLKLSVGHGGEWIKSIPLANDAMVTVRGRPVVAATHNKAYIIYRDGPDGELVLRIAQGPQMSVPYIYVAGYMDTYIYSEENSNFNMLAYAFDQTGLPIRVHLKYQDAFTGVFLYDDGQHNDFAAQDNLFGLTGVIPANSLPPNTTILLELQAENITGNFSLTWPYFEVTSIGSQYYNTKSINQIV